MEVALHRLDAVRAAVHGRLLLTEEAAPASDGTKTRIAVVPASEVRAALGAGARLHRAEHARGAPAPGYLQPEAGLAWWAELAGAHPDTGLVDLGRSREGRPLLAMWLGQPPSRQAPAVRLLAGHHGDEPSSVEIAVDLALTLLRERGRDPRVGELLASSTVWVVPWVNPDGLAAGTRFNAAGVDLNRNYDYAWDDAAWASGEGPFSEPETAAMQALGLLVRPHLSLSLHSGAENIGYVWNYTLAAPPEEATLIALAERYAEPVSLPGFWVTNGAAWYPTEGDTNDWSYGRYGGMDFTVEVSRRKAPAASQLPALRAAHREAALAFLTTPPGLVGRVVDASSGAPIEARLVWEPADGPETMPFFSLPASGAFARVVPATPGVLHVAAPGFAPARVRLSAGASEAVVVPLRPNTEPAPPAPLRVVRPGDAWSLPLPVQPGEVLLSRVGFPSVRRVVAGGAIEVPEDLAPGAWDVTPPGGSTWPRALLVSGGAVAEAHREDGGWTVVLRRDAPGAMAWALVGPRRAWEAVDVVREGDATLRLRGVRPGDDVLLWVGGTWEALPGVGEPVEGEQPLDTGRATDTEDGPADSALGPEEARRARCGCGPSHDRRGALWLLAAAFMWRRRR